MLLSHINTMSNINKNIMALLADADNLIQKAKRLENPSFLSKFFSTPAENEIADLYEKAADIYNVNNEFMKAGDSYRIASDLYYLNNIVDRGYVCLEKAVKSYYNCNFDKTIACLEFLIKIDVANNKFTSASNRSELLGDIHDTKDIYDKAIINYTRAADFLNDDPAKIEEINRCRIKAAKLSAMVGNFNQAIEIFNLLIMQNKDHVKYKFQTPDYVLSLALCYLANGKTIELIKYIDYYDQICHFFRRTREHKLIMDLIPLFEKSNIEAMMTLIRNYEIYDHMGEWKHLMISYIKKFIVTRSQVAAF